MQSFFEKPFQKIGFSCQNGRFVLQWERKKSKIGGIAMKPTYTVIRSGRKTLALEIRRDGEVIVRAPYRCSEQRIEAMLAEKASWIEKHLQALPSLPLEPTPEERELLKAAAERFLPPRVALYAEAMGLQPRSVKITSATRRFGSCSSRGGLCFSYRLMAYPLAAVDYVIVHELAHLKHLNHSPAFHALVERYLPDSRARRELLKQPPIAWNPKN